MASQEVMVRICQPLPPCYVLSSPRFWETRDQHFPGSLSLSGSREWEEEDPGNEVVKTPNNCNNSY